ncbi:MAG TPA: RND transporter, partial [Verrucomicrobiales bacterium]|nr:RND transporter [Verrucomicrobiales bacterium]
GVNAGVTGESVLDFDEMVQSQTDSTRATIFSLVLVALIFIFGYRQVGRPLKATACLIVGLGYTMAFTTATVGHLNILTITFVPMLIGLAIDFGVHLITRFEEELQGGHSEREAVTTAMVFTGKGIFTGCLTTAGAFAAMAITDFRGIREMGIICGGGLVISLIPMLTLLPAWLLKRHKSGSPQRHRTHKAAARRAESPEFRARLERLWLERPWTVLGIAAALTVGAALSARRVHFDYNLRRHRCAYPPSVQFEHKLVHSAEKSVIFGAVMATNLAEATALEARLRNQPTVGSVESMASYLAADPGAKLDWIRQVRRTTEPIDFVQPDPRAVDVHDLSQTLWSLQGYLGLAADEVAARGKTNLLKDMLSLRAALGEFRTEMFRGSEAEQEQKARQLGAFQQALFSDLRDTIGALQTQSDSGGLRPGDLPPALRNRFIGVQGQLLLQVYPRTNVWDRVPQAAFVEGLREIAPKVTGAPVQMYYYTELLKQSYVEAAGWALAAIVLLVGLHFRRISSIILALVPVALGALWVVGLMGFTGVSFNPANVMMLPLVIGIGVTNGIHILNRFAEERHPSILAKSTGKAVLVSGLTTIAGFGSLVLAKHQGILSLGFVMALGTATCMIAGLTVLPAILTLRERRQGRAGK